MSTTEIVRLVQSFCESARGERQPWDNLFQEVADYLRPKRAAFTTGVVSGANDFDYLFDDTGPWALEQFANGLHSMLTSPTSQWFGLQPRDISMRENRELLEWRDMAVRVLYDQFNSTRSSFHPAIQEAYTDVGAFGYGALYSEWSEADGAVLFQARFPGELYLIDDVYGRTNGIARFYKLTISQFVEEYGEERLPPEDRRHWREKGAGADKKIAHLVLPMSHPIMQRGVTRKVEGHQYGSIRVCSDIPDGLLVAGGYRSFPFHLARWGKWTGQVYSSSPGIVALPSVRRANAIARDLVVIANRYADPPTQGPDDEFLMPYDMSPGAQNRYRPGSQDRIEVISAGFGDPTFAQQLLGETQQSILRMLYVDAFLATADSNGQNVKATFVLQRRDEQFRQLAAMLSRLGREFLGSIVERTFLLCEENGLIPPVPLPVEFDVEFMSPIVRAQRSETVDGLYPLLELMGLGANYDPSVAQFLNWPRAMGDIGREIYGLPMAWFRTEEELAEMRQQQEEQQAMMTESQVAGNVAGAVRDIASAGLSQTPRG